MNKYEEMMFERVRGQQGTGMCAFCEANRLQRVWEVNHFEPPSDPERGCGWCPFIRFTPNMEFCLQVGPRIWNRYANFFEGSVWDDKVSEV